MSGCVHNECKVARALRVHIHTEHVAEYRNLIGKASLEIAGEIVCVRVCARVGVCMYVYFCVHIRSV